MRLLNEREQVRSVAERWRALYPSPMKLVTGNSDEIQRKLDALDPETATASDVLGIVGNASWVKQPICVECSEVVEHAVTIDEVTDSGEDVILCEACLNKALELVRTRVDPDREGRLMRVTTLVAAILTRMPGTDDTYAALVVERATRVNRMIEDADSGLKNT